MGELLMLYILQLIIVAIALVIDYFLPDPFNRAFKTKLQFLFWLIPFIWIIIPFIELYKMIKKLPWK